MPRRVARGVRDMLLWLMAGIAILTLLAVMALPDVEPKPVG